MNLLLSDLPLFKEDNLLKIFEEIHNYIYANDGLSSQQTLEEIIRILFIKIFDENSDDTRFFLSEEEWKTLQQGKKVSKFEERITDLFEQTKRAYQSGLTVNDEIRRLLIHLFSEQENFSKVRNVNRASVKLRFRIMTEVKAEGNILNSKKYPEIADNILSFVIPNHTEDDKIIYINSMFSVFGKHESEKFRVFPIKHHFNGYFLVFQINLI